MAVRLDMPTPSSRPLLPVARVDPSRLKCHEIAQQGCRPAVAFRTARRAPQTPSDDFFHIACHVRKPDRRS
jgi:hypothetical protein